ncbi:uncharacterized protein LACBIDRAFT_312167 [Laccaria bicolor S238N-H82]|uniref:Predicted protein n=1 Tax=Laccaria bicolor (strain S238N-H82 / ATCC MYA-4686) TaxID=486041 RepID=B0DVN1_LACBS|nr:uncharacterized protein LACBIDRAFT_312167 [Laccaria bicolor S238N-H82]EDR01329.1 predicted protein [Laccaria bicolor S238N-H82]|eukprot:XP_001888036.1 predicted protein [Laccaria bicolor S238N-H82]
MRWRILDLEKIRAANCFILCGRSWMSRPNLNGIRIVKFVDSSRVSFSNPNTQWLHTDLGAAEGKSCTPHLVLML